MSHKLATETPSIGAETASWRDALIAGLFAGCASLLVLAAIPGSQDARALVVIYPPWTPGEQALQLSWEAGLTVLRQGVHPSVVVVAYQEEGLSRARPAGAWLMLSLDGLAGCLDGRAAERAR